MSTPPVPPSNPNEPESGSEPAPETPQYGQNAPQYGQQPPAAPQYGQNAPQYGQQPPAAPQYGQNAPQYGQQPPAAPQYGQNAPQYGQAPQQYGQSPYTQYPSQFPQAQAAGGVPQLVNISFWLLAAAAAVWIISLLLAIPALDDPAMRRQFEQQMASSGANIDFESIKGVVIGTMVAIGLIGVGLYALVAFNVRRGKNWARILGTVFAALSIFSLFPPSVGSLGPLLGIVAIVLLYMPAAAPYFRKQQPFSNPYSQPGNPYGR
jgi:hypothetical protein